MKLFKRVISSIFLIIIIGSGLYGQKSMNGFWEGPHPSDLSKKFYIHMFTESEETKAKGYWTENSFYRLKFQVDSVLIKDKDVVFRIPSWGCYYEGKLINPGKISGGFQCIGEPYDSVVLTKNNEIANYLIKPKSDFYDHYKYKYLKPEIGDEILKVATYASKQDSSFIYSLMQEIIDGEYGRINSFLLIKDNRLICEEYFYGFTKEDLHHIESSNKSLTSLLIGIAKDKGFLTDINEPICQIFPEYKHLKDSGYNQITIKNLLTMSSGFGPEDNKIYRSNNYVKYILEQKLVDAVGDKFAYNGSNTEVLGAIIKKKTGMFADEFAKKYLFDPLNIKRYNWEKQNAYPCMGGSLQLLPRDFAKIGFLVLKNGELNESRIISEEWIKESTSEKIKTHIDGDNYSYQWWNINLTSDNKNYKVIWANGWGGQFLYIIPQLNVVIATIGYNYEYDSWAITKGIQKYLYLLDN